MKAEILVINAQVQPSKSLGKRSNLIFTALQKIIHRSAIDTCENTLTLAVDEYVVNVLKQDTLANELKRFHYFMGFNLSPNIDIRNKARILDEMKKVFQR